VRPWDWPRVVYAVGGANYHTCVSVSAGVLKVRLDTKAPKKLSYILHLHLAKLTWFLPYAAHYAFGKFPKLTERRFAVGLYIATRNDLSTEVRSIQVKFHLYNLPANRKSNRLQLKFKKVYGESTTNWRFTANCKHRDMSKGLRSICYRLQGKSIG